MLSHEERIARPFLIGITGGIGSGKSTVGKMLIRKGFIVIDADEVARELTSSGSSVLRDIVALFGEDVLSPDGSLDRRKVASIVFNDEVKRKALEKLLHPLVVKEMERRAVESGAEVVFLVMPLLFEAGLEKKVDLVWLCYADEEVRVARCIARDGVEREEVMARLKAQMPDEEKLRRADVVIDTSCSLDAVERRVDEELDRLGIKRRE